MRCQNCEFPTGTSRCAYAHIPTHHRQMQSSSPQSVKKGKLSPDEGLEAADKVEVATSLAQMSMQLRGMKYQCEGVQKVWKAQYSEEWSGHKDYDML